MGDKTTVFFTSQVLLGTSFGWAGSKASLVRSATEKSIDRIVRIADANGASAVVFCGSLYDDRFRTPGIAEFLRQLFASTSIPIVLVPGSADPWHETCLYRLTDWSSNVRVVSEPTWTSLKFGDVVLWATAQHRGVPPHPLGDLQLPPGSDVTHNVAVVDSYDSAPSAQEAPCFLCIAGTRASETGPRWFAPGAPQRHTFGSDQRGSVSAVMFTSAGITLGIHPVEHLDFRTMNIAVDNFDSRASIRDALRRLEDQYDGALRLVIIGSVDHEIDLDSIVAGLDRTSPIEICNEMIYEPIQPEVDDRGNIVRSTFIRLVAEAGLEPVSADNVRTAGLLALQGHTEFRAT